MKVGMKRCVVICIWSLLAYGSAGQGPNSKTQQALPNGNVGMDKTKSGRKTMMLELLEASKSRRANSDDSTTAPTIASAPSSGSSAPTSSLSGKESKGGKGGKGGKDASVESSSNDFYPRTKGKKSSKLADVPGDSSDVTKDDSYAKSGKKKKKSKKSKSQGASKSKIKNSKKSRSKKGEESMSPTSLTLAPTIARPPTGFPTMPPNDMPTPSLPPSPIPTSLPPSPTPILRVLTPYTLEYTTTEDRLPFRSEYMEAVEVTSSYLSGFFIDQFADSDMTLLEEFLTLFVNPGDFGQPIPIEYESTAVFDNSSAVVPGVAMLDRTLESAFEGANLNGFIGMLQALPPGNVFSTTIFVNKTDTPGMMVRSSSSNSRAGATTAGAVAGAAGFALLVAGLVVSKRRQGSDAGRDGPTKKSSGTVSGNETVAGETYMGGWSIDQASETQPFQSYTDQEQVDFRMVDEDIEDDASEGEDTTSGDDTELTDVALEWDGALRSISLSR